VAWRVLKLCLAFACPLTTFPMQYSVISLFDQWNSLCPSRIYTIYIGSKHDPTHIWLHHEQLGLCISILRKCAWDRLGGKYPKDRTIPLLVPIYSGVRAALSLPARALTGLICCDDSPRESTFQCFIEENRCCCHGPLTVVLVNLLMGFSWLIGGSPVLMTSGLLYGGLGVVEQDDLAEAARAFAPERTVTTASESSADSSKSYMESSLVSLLLHVQKVCKGFHSHLTRID
jgi:hypothetical protein